MEFLNYAYVFLWALLAVMSVVVGRKEGLLAYLVALFFVYMAVWYGLRAFAGLAMFEGAPVVIFRCVIGVFAVIFLIFLVKRHQNR